MAIDASIYSNVQTPQINIPSPLDNAQKAMTLSQLGMQQMQMQKQIQTQQAVNQSYRDNTDQSGNLNQQGFLSDLSKVSPQTAMQYQTQFAASNKAQAETQAAKDETAQKNISMVNSGLDYLAGMAEDQRAAAYPAVMKQLSDNGVDTSKMPAQYDHGHFVQTYAIGQQMKDYLANQLTQAQIGKTQSETGQVAQKRLQDYQMKLQDDDQYKAATKTLTQGNGVLSQINDASGPNGNPQSKAALGLALARLTPDGTRLPADEIQKQALAGNFGDKIKQMVADTTTGTLNPAEQDYATRFVNNQMGSAAQAKADRAKEYAGQFSQDTGADPKTAFRQLTATPAGSVTKTPSMSNGGQEAGQAGAPLAKATSAPAISPDDTKALNWLKTADPSSQDAFSVRAKLKKKGLL